MSSETSEKKLAICPFKVGDRVRFSPSSRTRGHYQNIEGLGIKIGEEAIILSVKEGGYLVLSNGCEGWSWNEFVRA
ncbi:MAG: hypothetical protein HY273_15930 [Gammaproteobacteria bacterium]|nr:hypothetical protein [Gammaproteobacteria bacterium]